MTDQEIYDQLSYYTLSHPDPAFIHQLIVDAYAAQHADRTSKPIYLAFALAGLYLVHEKGYTGKAVQNAHILLAKQKAYLPTCNWPPDRGVITVADVEREPPGIQRDGAIQTWSSSVWQAWGGSHGQVAEWIKQELSV